MNIGSAPPLSHQTLNSTKTFQNKYEKSMSQITFKEAIDSRQFDTAEQLIRAGADLLQSPFQFKLSDAFPRIIQHSAYSVLKALVENGHIELDIFDYDSFRDTLFEALVLHGKTSPEALDFLNGFIPDVENLNDSLEDATWLGLALQTGAEPEIVRTLIEQGCDLQILNNADENLFFDLLASTHVRLQRLDRRRELFQVLIDAGLDINRPNKVGNTVLHLAVRNQHWELVNELLDQGADPNLANQKGETAYSICILDFQDSAHCAEMMERYPLDLHAERGKEKTLLYEWLTRLYASSLGEQESYFLQVMLENGADPNAENTNDYGETETVWDVVVAKSYEFFEAFVDAFDPDVNQQDNNGNTLLHQVCAYDINFDQNQGKDTYRKAKKLLKMGADPSIRNTQDETAADIAGKDSLKEKTVLLLVRD